MILKVLALQHPNMFYVSIHEVHLCVDVRRVCFDSKNQLHRDGDDFFDLALADGQLNVFLLIDFLMAVLGVLQLVDELNDFVANPPDVVRVYILELCHMTSVSDVVVDFVEI
jgi:hypothetical protein